MVKHKRFAGLAALLLCAVALAALPLVVGAGNSGEISSALGRQLLLVSPAQSQVQALGALPLALHAEVGGQAGRYLASGQPNAYQALRSGGIQAVVLDPDTRKKVYYFLDAQAKDARTVAQKWGSIFFEDDRQILVGVPAARESAFLDTIAQTPIHIELLTSLPLRRPTGISLPVRGTEATEPNPTIASLLSLVTPARLSERMAELSGERAVTIGGKKVTLQTRYTFSGQIGDALAYVRQALAGLGLTVQDVEWAYGRYRGINLVADMAGSKNPERIWLLGGHLDDRSETSYSRAPGADDNASGVAAMLVIAEALKGQRFEDTVRFVAFTGEEQGMWGSKSYAARLSSSGAQVMGFINLDMIAWDGNNDRVAEVHSGTRQPSVDLANAFAAVNARYDSGLALEIKGGTASRFSDHSSFWDAGYPAFLSIEDFYADGRPADRNPKYHNTGDALGQLRLDYAVRHSRAALAALAEWAAIASAQSPIATRTATATAPAALSPTRTATATLPAGQTGSPTRTATATGSRTASPTATLAAGQPAPPTPVATATVPTRHTATPTPTATALPGNCRDILVNGGMEAEAGWSFGQTARRAGYQPAPVVAERAACAWASSPRQPTG